MIWKKELIDRVALNIPCGYQAHGSPATEPTAWAGLALTAHDRLEQATQVADWLTRHQTSAGSVGVTPSQQDPPWPTSLGILVWTSLNSTAESRQYLPLIERTVKWTLAEEGGTAPRQPHIGHDTTLVGWSWATNTHSWLEPTALFVLALKSAGHIDHPRTREAVRLLIDRQLPAGGCNYGNTLVLGQELLPHVQPTGLVMLALAGEPDDDPRTERSLLYLERSLGPQTSAASLCYGVLALAAHQRRPTSADDWLEAAYRRELNNSPSPYKLALIALAAATTNPLVTVHRRQPPVGHAIS